MERSSTLRTLGLSSLLVSALAGSASAQSVGTTTVLGGFTGGGAPLHSDNKPPVNPTLAYYGTDLGFTYKHGTKINFMFGDTWANEAGNPIQPSTFGWYDDGFGTVDASVNPTTFSPTNIPKIKLGQITGTSEMKAYNPGNHPMEFFKTPVGGFSNGTREFGIFYTAKPQGCTVNGDCDNQVGNLTCDPGLGYFGNTYENQFGFTGGCVDGDLFCSNDTMTFLGFPVPGSGFCRDTGSTMYGGGATPEGRIMAIGLKHRIGMRSTTDDRSYTNIREWLTNKYLNVAVATVQDFIPGDGSGWLNQNYNVAGSSGMTRRVFLWGRPGFIGTSANNRRLGLYFAYVDMPAGSTFSSWTVNYFKQMNGTIPVFSQLESDAAALDLDAITPGTQINEPKDIVNQMSVVWVERFKKWVMFYGGGATNLPFAGLPECGVVEFFLGPDECHDVVMDNTVYMRTADNPWGPWTTPVPVLTGGLHTASPLPFYYSSSSGVLRHPNCTVAGCADHTDGLDPAEYGFFYGASIVQPWIRDSGTGVDLIWLTSTWDPYRVMMVRTHLNPP